MWHKEKHGSKDNRSGKWEILEINNEWASVNKSYPWLRERET